MLRLVDHSAELIEKLDGVVQGDEELSGEYTRVDSRSVKHEDILQLVKFVRKHNKHLQRNDFGRHTLSLIIDLIRLQTHAHITWSRYSLDQKPLMITQHIPSRLVLAFLLLI